MSNASAWSVTMVPNQTMTMQLTTGVVYGGEGSAAGGFEITVMMPTPATGTYTLRGYPTRAGTITNVRIAETASGSVTASLLTGGTLSGGVVTGGTAVTGFPSTINSTPQTATLSAAFDVGDAINFVISGVTGASGLVLTITGTNT